MMSRRRPRHLARPHAAGLQTEDMGQISLSVYTNYKQSQNQGSGRDSLENQSCEFVEQ